MIGAAVLAALKERGPLTGAELRDAVGGEDLLGLWRFVHRSPAVTWTVAGRRYLRLDRSVPGYARLSPSIKREFLTYTVVHLPAQAAAGEARREALGRHVRAVSREKLLLARERVGEVLAGLIRAGDLEPAGVTVLLGGDVVYAMAHDVPRPEVSTGKLVRGSDLDVVVVVRDGTDTAALDAALLQAKFSLLHHPGYREEIDYVIKDLSRVEEQLRFDRFEHQVACKILHEAVHLAGSAALHREIRRRLAAARIPAKLAVLTERARRYRAEAERRLLAPEGLRPEEARRFFYTQEEDPEIF